MTRTLTVAGEWAGWNRAPAPNRNPRPPYPHIRIRGRYLERLGIHAGGKITVTETTDGLLIRPQPETEELK